MTCSPLPGGRRAAAATIGKHDTTIVMHNDAVVQGLSEAPFVHEARQWRVLTIGTGLGNAVFRNRQGERESGRAVGLVRCCICAQLRPAGGTQVSLSRPPYF